MHRLFVAIDLPEEAKEAVYRLKEDIRGARWVPEPQLHLTLQFIGDADDALLQRLTHELSQTRCPAFDLTLHGTGHFPPRGLPRVLWVGIEAGPNLFELQTAVEQASIAAGFAPDERRFSPHLTLARLKETPPEVIREFEARHGGFRHGPCPITGFHLFESTLSQHGAIHRRLESVKLA